MKINRTLYRTLLLNGLALLSFEQYASMEDVIKAGQSLQQDVNAIKSDLDTLKSTVSQLSSGNVSPSSENQLTPEASINSKAIQQLTDSIDLIERSVYNISRLGKTEYEPLYTTEAKPGFMAMASEHVRNDYKSRKKFEDSVTSVVDWFTKPRTQGEVLQDVVYLGVLGLAIPVMAVSAKTALDIIKFRMTTPKPLVLLPGFKYGRTDRWKRWWAGYKTPPMIFDQSVKERLEEIEEKTRNIRDHIRNGQKITYDNLLLYGKPGTGKTLFAQILADKIDMDFLPVTAASLLQSGVEGIKYFDELVTMANKSKYGVIIFVDEADALFVNRDSLQPDSDLYKVLNHILAATNHAYVMDPAMGRRFQDRVEMPLPDVATRKELLTIYMDEQLFNAKNRNSQFISAARVILTDARMNEIAQQTAGLSHAEIKDMVTIMGKKANATKDGIITQRNVDSAVAEAIEKMKALERDKMELEKKTFHMRSQVQPQIRTNVMEEEGAAAAA